MSQVFNLNDESKSATIRKIVIDEQEIVIFLNNHRIVRILDDGQCCCETRYITCDDNPIHLIGGYLINVEVADAFEREDENYGDIHEISFLNINTTLGSIQCATHNEHNGYYGGFDIKVKEEKYK